MFLACFCDGLTWSRDHNAGFEKFTSDKSKENKDDGEGSSKKGVEEWRRYVSDPENRGTLITIGVAAVVGYFMLKRHKSANEINWQEFKVQYLNRGEVNGSDYNTAIETRDKDIQINQDPLKILKNQCLVCCRLSVLLL